MLVDVSTYRSPWRTSEELSRAKSARGYFAKLREEELAKAKPPRNTSWDGEISKRRDKS